MKFSTLKRENAHLSREKSNLNKKIIEIAGGTKGTENRPCGPLAPSTDNIQIIKHQSLRRAAMVEKTKRSGLCRDCVYSNMTPSALKVREVTTARQS